VLGHFLDHGQPPTRQILRAAASALGLDPSQALRALDQADLIHLGAATTGDTDDAGSEADLVGVACPLSGAPTAHRVRLAGGPAVFAMCCAIDALGIPLMIGRDALIDSTDAHAGAPIHVSAELRADGWHWTWEPAASVVLVAWTSSSGPSQCCSCPYINFYIHPDHARADLAAHSPVQGVVFNQADAVRVAGRNFGPLLHD